MDINIKLIVVVVIVAVMLVVLHIYQYGEDSMFSSKNTQSQEHLNIGTEGDSMDLSYRTIANDCIETLVECQEALEAYSMVCDRLMPARLIGCNDF